jgi:ribosomal protein S18 acetylase RimI-like enzyme
MTTANELTAPDEDRAYADLIHQNAILGCRSWSEWEHISFEQSKEITWYYSSIRDILFNSVLDSELDLTPLKSSIEKVITHCKKTHSGVAWLIPEPKRLTKEHRELFMSYEFRECTGTTGMYLELQKPELQKIYMPKVHDHLENLSITVIQDDELLKLWAKVLIDSYQFPKALMVPWYELHRAIGYKEPDAPPPFARGDGTPGQDLQWEHLVLSTEEGEVIATSSLLYGPGTDNSSFANLAVVPSHRGSGVGSLLVRHCLARLASAGYRSTTLYASQDAFGLYSRLGFRSTFRNIFYVLDPK